MLEARAALSSLARTQVASVFLRLRGALPKGVLCQKEAPFFCHECLGVGTFFLFRRTRFLILNVGRSFTLSFRVYALFHLLGTLLFPLPREKKVSSCRLRGKRSYFLLDGFAGPVCFSGRSCLLSHELGGSSLPLFVGWGSSVRDNGSFFFEKSCPLLLGPRSLQSSRDLPTGNGARF